MGELGEKGVDAVERDKELSISELYRSHYDKMVSYAWKILKNKEEAEEVVQDTFVAAVRKESIVLSSPNPRGWLVLALKNMLYHAYKREKVHRLLIENVMIDFEVSRGIATDELAGLETLYGGMIPREEFDILVKAVIEREPVRDIARELNISEEAAYKRIQRAKKRMRKALEESENIC